MMRKLLGLLSLCCFLILPAITQAASLPMLPGKNAPDSAGKVGATLNGAVLKNALAEYKNLSRKEKKFRIKESKALLKEYKVQKKAGTSTDTNTLLLVILAILLPPLAVYLHENAINTKFWIDLLLTLLFFLPGIIYALIVILGG
ncbi:YqaE/Pmp3 family membrane protein [Hydrotalea sp.]|uniref:YqaE/Pmp3 family membrane protein n=1 Tax=Hydrotalea sp. TaxID=2881279 RepID=UPI003D0D5099